MRTSTKLMIAISTPLFFLFAGWVKEHAVAAWEREIAQVKAEVIVDAEAALEKSRIRLGDAFASLAPDRENSAEPVLSEQEKAALQDRRKDACIGAVIWGEARGEPAGIDQMMTGWVDHMRAVDGWFDSHDECYQACKSHGAHREFDSTKRFCAQLAAADKAGKLPPVAEDFVEMGRKIRTGEFKPPERCRNVRFFANFAESSPGGIRDFQRHTKIRCVFEGSHLFAEEKQQIRKAVVAQAKVRRHFVRATPKQKEFSLFQVAAKPVRHARHRRVATK